MHRMPQSALLAVHNTTTARITEAREVWLEYDANDERWHVPAGSWRRATGRPHLFGVPFDALFRNRYSQSCSYSYSLGLVPLRL